MSTQNDPKSPGQITEDHQRADQYAKPGSVQHFMLRMGFMPDNEQVAEKILTSIIREWEALRS